MRGRAVGLGLLGLGAFALVAALLVHVLLVPALVKLPLDQKADPRATGTVTFFDIGAQQQRDGVAATVTQHVKGDPAAPGAGDDVAVWNFGSTVTGTDAQLLSPVITYRVCLDRRTAEAVSCPSAQVGNGKGHLAGLTLTFPFHTQRTTYRVFDPNAGAAFPARFLAVEKVAGLTVYRFEQTVPETVILSQDVPGSMAGVPDQATVRADAVYSSRRTFWVEPTSGVIVKQQDEPKTVLRGPGGTTGATMLAGTLTADGRTVADLAATAKDTAAQITMLGSVLPWSLVAIGLLALLAGGTLVARAAQAGRHAEPRDDPAAQPLVPQAQ